MISGTLPSSAPGRGWRRRAPRSSARSASDGRPVTFGEGTSTAGTRRPRAPRPSRPRARARGSRRRAPRRAAAGTAAGRSRRAGSLAAAARSSAPAEVQDRRPLAAECVDHDVVQRLRAQAPAHDQQDETLRRQPELAARLVAWERHGARRDRPPRRPGSAAPIGPGSGTRARSGRANGAAIRLASPKCASASVSAAGIRARAAASTIGPPT